tara:strand:+ start:153 stop:434 length:282 start_codon:yes stop_codon:yes gene_type:complete
MINFEKNPEDFYFCSCSNWNKIVLAKSVKSAASKAISETLKELGLDTVVSPVMMVRKITKDFADNDELIRVDQVFDDIGMYKEAENLREILEL